MGIYKDGHERPDTVAYRKLFITELKTLKSRELTYTGDKLEMTVPPKQTGQAEVVRVYHDECIYASHEGAIQCWVAERTDGKYKKTRGEIVMASGFICRYVRSMHCYVTFVLLLIKIVFFGIITGATA
jgi:hypothetical protein